MPRGRSRVRRRDARGRFRARSQSSNGRAGSARSRSRPPYKRGFLRFAAESGLLGAGAGAAYRYGRRYLTGSCKTKARGSTLGGRQVHLQRATPALRTRAYKTTRKAGLSLEMRKAIAEYQFPKHRGYNYNVEVQAAGVGKASWFAHTCSDKDNYSRLYQLHQGAIALTYQRDPQLRMICRQKSDITAANSTNQTQFYKFWVYTAKNDYVYFGGTPILNLSGQFRSTVIRGDVHEAEVVPGITTGSMVDFDDINAIPSMNSSFTTDNKMTKSGQFSLGPGDTKKITLLSPEFWFNPAKFNNDVVALTGAPAATYENDVFKNKTVLIYIRCVGTLVSEQGAPAIVSTAPTQTQYVIKKTYTSQIIQEKQSVITNHAELSAALTVPITILSDSIKPVLHTTL